MVRKEVRRRTSLLMGVSLALLLGAAAAFFVFALPQHLLERLTVLTGLSRLMVQAEPPISSNDRALLAALAGIGTMGLGWVLIDWLLLGRAGMSVLIRPREDDYEDGDEGYRPADPLDLVTPAPRAIDLPIAMPLVNPADPRKPLSARTDIGDPPQPPLFAPPPMPTVGRQDVPNGQMLPPLDQLFAEAARAPVPPAPVFPARSDIAPHPVAATTPAASSRITPDLSAEDVLNPADIFKGMTIPAAPPQMPQPSVAPPPPPVLPADFWMPARDAALPEAIAVPRSPAPESFAPPVNVAPHPAAPVQSPPPLAARAGNMPDMRVESFPPDLPDLPDSPFFVSPPPPFAAPASVFIPPADPVPTIPVFAPPIEPEPVAWTTEPAEPEPEAPIAPEAVAEPATHWSPPPAQVVFTPPPVEATPFEPPAEDMPLEDMLARLELGMQKRRVAALAPPPATEPQRRPLPAYAAAPPVREVPVPPVMAVVPPVASEPAPEPAWTPPASATAVAAMPVSPPPSSESDGLLDQPLHVALGVLRNLVRG